MKSLKVPGRLDAEFPVPEVHLWALIRGGLCITPLHCRLPAQPQTGVFMLKIVFFLGSFWLIQGLVAIGFKLSSLQEHRFWLWFCAAHALGAPSLWFLVRLYKQMSEPVAFGLAFGGAFLASQIALFLAFRPATTLVQWVGVLAICGGMVMLAMGGPRPAADVIQTPPSTVSTGS